MKNQYRYPGTRPYLEEDGPLFFGRNSDREKLTELIVLEKLVVLFGKSGYGKSSLLNAAVIPNLRKLEKHEVFNIRLIEPEHPNHSKRSPLELLITQLSINGDGPSFLREKLNIATDFPEDLTAIIWYYAKMIQLGKKDSRAITLIFDQFEELSHFSEEQIEAFGRSMETLLNLNAPKSVRRLIEQKIDANAGYFTKDETHDLLKPLNLKVVFSLHHDRLNLLDQLKRFLPTVFKYTYELKPLGEIAAREALHKPASLAGKFASPVFAYTEEATAFIFSNLKDSKNQLIEPFQLQLIGQHAEERIIAKQKKAERKASRSKQKPNRETPLFELGSKDLDKPATIFKKHYQKVIAGLPFWKRRNVRDFIETKLIIEGNRVPIPEAVITSGYNVSKSTLEDLLDQRLLRSELNTVQSTSYELSHDSLVKPIQDAAKKRRQRRTWIWAIVVFLVISGLLATWGTYEKVRADDLEKKYEDYIKQYPKSDTPSREKIVPPGNPVARVSAAPSYGMAPLDVKFTGSVSDLDESVSFLWEFNDGTTSTTADPEHTFFNKGTYDVRLTVTDSRDRKGFASIKIMVDSLQNKGPVAKASATPTSGTAPLEVAFRGSGSVDDGPLNYHWNFDDGSTSSDPDPVHSFARKGNYNVHLTVEDQGGQMDSTMIEIKAMDRDPTPIRAPATAPRAKISAPIVSGTAPLEVAFKGSGSSAGGPANYSWDFDDGSTSTDADPVHTFADKGTYNVQLTVTDKVNPELTNTDSAVIRVKAPLPPMAKASASAVSGKAPLKIAFKGSGSPGGGIVKSYKWDFDDGATSSDAEPVHSFVNKGRYHVQLTVEDDERQRDSTIIEITVEPPFPDPNKWITGLEPRDSVHLVGIRHDPNTRPFDAIMDEGLLILFISDRAYLFRSAKLPQNRTSSLKSLRTKLKSPQTSQKRRPFILSGQRYISYINTNEKFIDYTKDSYEELFDLIRDHTKKGEPYYTFIDASYFDTETQNEINNVYRDLGKK